MQKLEYTQLKRIYDINNLDFENTAELNVIPNIIVGQSKGIEALKFGLNVKSKGYNIYVAGDSGTGKTTYAKKLAEDKASEEAAPCDLCYVYNFENHNEPIALKLERGTGKKLKKDLKEVVELIEEELNRIFNSKNFQEEKNSIIKEFEIQKQRMIRTLSERTVKDGFGVKSTNSEIYLMPIVNGVVLTEEEFDELSETEKLEIAENSAEIQKDVQLLASNIRDIEKIAINEIESREYTAGLKIIGNNFSELLEKYKDQEQIINHIMKIKEDMLNNIDELVQDEIEEEQPNQMAMLLGIAQKKENAHKIKYDINVLVDNSDYNNAKVIVDYNPIATKIVGDIEYENEPSGVVTDFTKIKAGLLHKANGGYLILQSYDLFNNGMSYEALRKFIKSGKVHFDYARENNNNVTVSTLKPQPFELDVKIILVGSYYNYDMLCEFDEEFCKFFKVVCEFDDVMEYNDDNANTIIDFVTTIINRENIKHLTKSAVGEVINYSNKISGQKNRLTVKLSSLCDLLVEANVYAGFDSSEHIEDKHIKKAIDEKKARLNMYEIKLNEMIDDNVIIIDTEGEKVGELNGLVIIDNGEYMFGSPTKITVSTFVGKDGIVNIEKEAGLSGRVHDKGVEVITGFLGHRYAKKFPLSFNCTIAFEQNYSGVDGDSASSTELYGILSSIANIPLKQNIAVTGSVNQRGDIQPIGGVTEKIEGFFDVCSRRGFKGGEGVIIPYQNIEELFLKDEVVEAVKNGLFTIYAIKHIDEGMEILTGLPIGNIDSKGKYESGSINDILQKQFKYMYKRSLLE